MNWPPGSPYPNHHLQCVTNHTLTEWTPKVALIFYWTKTLPSSALVVIWFIDEDKRVLSKDSTEKFGEATAAPAFNRAETTMQQQCSSGNTLWLQGKSGWAMAPESSPLWFQFSFGGHTVIYSNSLIPNVSWNCCTLQHICSHLGLYSYIYFSHLRCLLFHCSSGDKTQITLLMVAVNIMGTIEGLSGIPAAHVCLGCTWGLCFGSNSKVILLITQ